LSAAQGDSTGVVLFISPSSITFMASATIHSGQNRGLEHDDTVRVSWGFVKLYEPNFVYRTLCAIGPKIGWEIY
jgi:hypothetical protein